MSPADRRLLKSVSRSFYLSVRVLPASLQDVIGIGYLLCRAADTVADALSLSLPERLALLQRFRSLFDSFPVDKRRLEPFLKDLSGANVRLSSAEGELLAGFDRCAALFNGLSKTDQALVQSVVRAVIQGMEMDLQTFGDSAATLKAFRTAQDLDAYITWIGGEPGRFWSRACLEHVPDLEPSDRTTWIEQGVDFGKGLQMVNILRDLPADLKNGRCYLPADRLAQVDLQPADLLTPAANERLLTLFHALIDETLLHLRRGLSYVERIPRRYVQLRAAVWWPMTLGLKTLRLLRRKPVVITEGVTKVSRWQVYRVVGTSLPILSFNRLLSAKFAGLSEDAGSRGV